MHSSFLKFPHDRTEFSDVTYAAMGRAQAYAISFEAICKTLSSLQNIRQRVHELLRSISDSRYCFLLRGMSARPLLSCEALRTDLGC